MGWVVQGVIWPKSPNPCAFIMEHTYSTTRADSIDRWFQCHEELERDRPDLFERKISGPGVTASGAWSRARKRGEVKLVRAEVVVTGVKA